MFLSSLIRIISTHFKFHNNSLRGLYDSLEIWNLIDMNRYLDYRHCILLFGKQSNPGLGRLSRSFSGTSHEESHTVQIRDKKTMKGHSDLVRGLKTGVALLSKQ